MHLAKSVLKIEVLEIPKNNIYKMHVAKSWLKIGVLEIPKQNLYTMHVACFLLKIGVLALPQEMLPQNKGSVPKRPFCKWPKVSLVVMEISIRITPYIYPINDPNG